MQIIAHFWLRRGTVPCCQTPRIVRPGEETGSENEPSRVCVCQLAKRKQYVLVAATRALYNIENPQDRLGNNLWCTCDNCVAMPTVKECLCCNEEPAELLDKLHEYYMECVIQHPDFRAVCLTDAVLEILMHCLREVRGYGADLQWENRSVLVLSIFRKLTCILICHLRFKTLINFPLYK